MTFVTVMLAKVSLMLCASFGLFVAHLLPRDGVAKRRIDLYFVALALLALFTYSHFGQFHAPRGYVHGWEMFNYYFPTKYAPRARLRRSVRCGARGRRGDARDPYFAEIETVRDLQDATGWSRRRRCVGDPVLPCSLHSPDRWQDFKRDLAYLQPNYDGRGLARSVAGPRLQRATAANRDGTAPIA